MRLEVFGLSAQGRRERNDDHWTACGYVGQEGRSLAVDPGSESFRSQGLLVAVADGMGGYEGGALASRVFLEALCTRFQEGSRAGLGEEALEAWVADCVASGQQELVQRLRADGLEDAGTTVAGVALFWPDVAVVFHVGDSRVLRLSGGFLRELTVDHTPVAADVESGRLTEAQAATLASAAPLVRSLGARGHAEPEIQAVTWALGDVFLLATDGMHGLGRGLSHDELKAAVEDEGELDGMVRSCVVRAMERDGSDNATLVAVRAV